jgi:hypothetical protein
MTLPCPPISPPEPDHDAQDALLYRDVLHELIAMGMDHTRDVHREAQAPLPGPRGKIRSAIDYANAHERLARGIRRSILLARLVAEPIPLRRSAAERRQADRTDIIRAVEDKIRRSAADHDADTLTAEFHERLDSLDLAVDLTHRPVAEIIIQICRDLGLESAPGADPWKRRKPRDLAILRARAAGPHPAPLVTLSAHRAADRHRVPPANSA